MAATCEREDGGECNYRVLRMFGLVRNSQNDQSPSLKEGYDIMAGQALPKTYEFKNTEESRLTQGDIQHSKDWLHQPVLHKIPINTPEMAQGEGGD